jgi:hypothetical protein
MLSNSKITKEEMAQNPEVVIKVLEFYNASQGKDKSDDQKLLVKSKSGNLSKSVSTSTNNPIKELTIASPEAEFVSDKAGETPATSTPKIVLHY